MAQKIGRNTLYSEMHGDFYDRFGHPFTLAGSFSTGKLRRIFDVVV